MEQLTLSDLDGERDPTLGLKLATEREFELKPQILCHPNIPKPLHGVNPRTIMGRAWWDVTRQEVYASTDYHCVACGVHKTVAKGPKWLEAHEFWEIDYETGLCLISSIEPLCHYCHNFIHSGRLEAVMETPKGKSREETIAILEHGIQIIKDNNLKMFWGTAEFAMDLGVRGISAKYVQKRPTKEVEWGEYRLEWEGEVYRGFETYDDWYNHYNKENE